MDALDFAEIQRRLVAHLSEKVRNGEITERRLARITGVSQPHMHNVLCGKRTFSMEMADQVLLALHKDLLDFLDPGDIDRWKNRE